MEQCQLALKLPGLTEKLDDPYHFQGDRDVVLLDVCELEWDTPREMDLKDISWSTRPPCRQQMGTFSATPGAEVSLPEFPCLWGELRTIEVSCSSQNVDCVVDVWSSQNATWSEFNTSDI